jgi:hypothetical protein
LPCLSSLGLRRPLNRSSGTRFRLSRAYFEYDTQRGGPSSSSSSKRLPSESPGGFSSLCASSPSLSAYRRRTSAAVTCSEALLKVGLAERDPGDAPTRACFLRGGVSPERHSEKGRSRSPTCPPHFAALAGVCTAAALAASSGALEVRPAGAPAMVLGAPFRAFAVVEVLPAALEAGALACALPVCPASAIAPVVERLSQLSALSHCLRRKLPSGAGDAALAPAVASAIVSAVVFAGAAASECTAAFSAVVTAGAAAFECPFAPFSAMGGRPPPKMGPGASLAAVLSLALVAALAVGSARCAGAALGMAPVRAVAPTLVWLLTGVGVTCAPVPGLAATDAAAAATAPRLYSAPMLAAVRMPCAAPFRPPVRLLPNGGPVVEGDEPAPRWSGVDKLGGARAAPPPPAPPAALPVAPPVAALPAAGEEVLRAVSAARAATVPLPASFPADVAVPLDTVALAAPAPLAVIVPLAAPASPVRATPLGLCFAVQLCPHGSPLNFLPPAHESHSSHIQKPFSAYHWSSAYWHLRTCCRAAASSLTALLHPL